MYKYLRDEIQELKNYDVNKVECRIKLDANEGIDWMEGLNRYPDDYCTILREMLATKLGVDNDELVFGNGSSELIEQVMRAYLDHDELVLSFSPTFAMYKIYTIINKGRYIDYPLENFQDLDVDGFIEFIHEQKPKVVLLCNPNNPTGSLIKEEDINKIVVACDCMVILDEAYVEFAYENPPINIDKYKNLIILRTFSKAYSVAGIRLGYMIADKEVIGYINRVRSPYNISTLAYRYGIKALESEELAMKNTKMVVTERDNLIEKMKEIGLEPVQSYTNFIFFKGPEGLADKMAVDGILIRAFGTNIYRMTISIPEENKEAFESMKNFMINEV